jgi:succinoglycan biosynthesis protein ExoA
MKKEATPAGPQKPIRFTVVIPCRNEAHTIAAVLADLERQDCPELFEVIVAEGRSEDATRDLLEKMVENRAFRFSLRIVDNPDKSIPSGLNRAVSAATGEYIVRIDAHARLPEHYLRMMTDALAEGAGDVVGPQVLNVPNSSSATAKTIAAMLNSRFGNGGTPSRSSIARPTPVVHTVMSCYRRAVWKAIGGYNESLLSNEDYEFDYRASRAGFSIVSLPRPIFQLIARSSLWELARQRWRYGKWKAKVLILHPGSVRLRQIIPILFLPATIWLAATELPFASMLLAIYCGIAGYSVLNDPSIRNADFSLKVKCVAMSPVVAAITHFVWSAGAFYGFINRPKPNRNNE